MNHDKVLHQIPSIQLAKSSSWNSSSTQRSLIDQLATDLVITFLMKCASWQMGYSWSAVNSCCSSPVTVCRWCWWELILRTQWTGTCKSPWPSTSSAPDSFSVYQGWWSSLLLRSFCFLYPLAVCFLWGQID
jgi:hypothetical protein